MAGNREDGGERRREIGNRKDVWEWRREIGKRKAG